MTDWRSVSVGFLELPVRAHTIFASKGIVTVGQIEDMPDDALLRFRGLGSGTLAELRHAVTRLRERYHETGYPSQRDRDQYAEFSARCDV